MFGPHRSATVTGFKVHLRNECIGFVTLYETYCIVMLDLVITILYNKIKMIFAMLIRSLKFLKNLEGAWQKMRNNL